LFIDTVKFKGPSSHVLIYNKLPLVPLSVLCFLNGKEHEIITSQANLIYIPNRT